MGGTPRVLADVCTRRQSSITRSSKQPSPRQNSYQLVKVQCRGQSGSPLKVDSCGSPYAGVSSWEILDIQVSLF